MTPPLSACCGAPPVSMDDNFLTCSACGSQSFCDCGKPSFPASSPAPEIHPDITIDHGDPETVSVNVTTGRTIARPPSPSSQTTEWWKKYHTELGFEENHRTIDNYTLLEEVIDEASRRATLSERERIREIVEKERKSGEDGKREWHNGYMNCAVSILHMLTSEDRKEV